jgi:Bifunctional DNA primase/polymerase, N-terminal
MHSQIKQVVEALEYLPQEWRVTPTFGKKPIVHAWQKNYFSPKELQEKLYFSQMKVKLDYKSVVPTGVAVICGEHPEGNLIAIDCDGLLSWKKILELSGISQKNIPKEIGTMRERALEFLPPTVAFTSGKEHRAQFLYVVPTGVSIKSVKLDNLELRGKNLASVLPPSYHPEGKKYR